MSNIKKACGLKLKGLKHEAFGEHTLAIDCYRQVVELLKNEKDLSHKKEVIGFESRIFGLLLRQSHDQLAKFGHKFHKDVANFLKALDKFEKESEKHPITIGKKVPNASKMKHITLISDRYREHLKND